MNTETAANPTACLIVIGNEILSGRTQDANINFLATKLGGAGIPVREVRIIPDVAETIIATVNEVRARFDYIFTTGGIGPTHDDITVDCIARAFGVPVIRHPEAMQSLAEYYEKMGTEFTDTRARMANAPEGADILENPAGKFPGFKIGNVHIMPGVPRVMQQIFEALLPSLVGGPPIVMHVVTCDVREGDLAIDLEKIALRYPQVDIGSYPGMRNGAFITQLVSKGSDAAAVQQAGEEVIEMVKRLGNLLEVA